MDTKICTKCGEDKPIEAFPERRSQCKECRKAYRAEYYKENKGKIRDRQARYYKYNKGKIWDQRYKHQEESANSSSHKSS